MTEPQYFTFNITEKGWHISYPEGCQRRHNINKINNDINKRKDYFKLLLDNTFILGDINKSYIIKKRFNI